MLFWEALKIGLPLELPWIKFVSLLKLFELNVIELLMGFSIIGLIVVFWLDPPFICDLDVKVVLLLTFVEVEMEGVIALD